MEKKLLQLLDELIQQKNEFLLKEAQKFYPYMTYDDLLQPNDFPLLENHPIFRYEEGVLHGMQAMQTAIRALLKNPVS